MFFFSEAQQNIIRASSTLIYLVLRRSSFMTNMEMVAADAEWARLDDEFRREWKKVSYLNEGFSILMNLRTICHDDEFALIFNKILFLICASLLS